MITRLSTLIGLFGLVVLAVGFSQDMTILLAVGIAMMVFGVIGFAIGVNRRKQTGNRILYFILFVIIAVAVVLGIFT